MACNRQGGAAPQEMRQLEESRRGARHHHNSSKEHDPPDHPKGGELVLKLFAFTQAFAAGSFDALRRGEEGQTMAEYASSSPSSRWRSSPRSRCSRPTSRTRSRTSPESSRNDA